MKKLINFMILLIMMGVSLVSCENVDSGHEGVEVKWGGKTNMEKVYGEGLQFAPHWLWDEIVQYDMREKTLVVKLEFNDKNNMKVPVEFAIDYKLQKGKSNVIHSSIGMDQLTIKITTSLSGAAKVVVPQYSASELNLNKRDEAENKVYEILKTEYPQFFVECSRVRVTDVDIPVQIADAAEQVAAQLELNKLSESKVIDARNKFDQAEFESKAKALLSRPEMLELKRLEVEMEYAKKGVSKYGQNNVFGVNSSALLKQL